MTQMTPSDVEMDLDADLFMRKLLRELTGLLQDVVGTEEATGFIASVGTAMGGWIGQKYRDGMGDEDIDAHEVAQIFCDLKRRIGGNFHVVSVDEDKIVMGNTRCPFGEMAQGRDALCMMTSNVFGRIAADHLGYARVDLEDTIARGSPTCQIVVHLSRSDGLAKRSREYYRSRHRDHVQAAE